MLVRGRSIRTLKLNDGYFRMRPGDSMGATLYRVSCVADSGPMTRQLKRLTRPRLKAKPKTNWVEPPAVDLWRGWEWTR